ncbi:ac transposable element-derived 4 [Fusarium mundagurra]|uniref:Ac transposable element-derived 4 n=1 Tax=Fusarium mundagurra TaxID=1567541 RepID=A0A8H5Z8F9_9HYPO|nr:ac transposable element-derived 4 [Fusarium mundagurra]
MSSLKIQDSIDDLSFKTPPLSDPTGVPNFPPEEGRGQDFHPFNLEYRDFKINPLPQEPLQLFQLFIPISLIQSWIKYTNSWVSHLQENGVIDNWNTPLSEHSRILKWEGLSSATAYVWLGVVIYLGIHREISIDHWKAPSLGDQRPLHSIIKFIPLRRFQLISRYLRTFDYTKINVRDESDLPKTFQAAEEWSELIQKVSTELYLPGTNLTVDECMVPFTGRSKEITLVKGKPTPVGFKVWVIAQQGFFLHLPTPKPQGKRGKLQTEIPLSNTQSVVVHLLKRLLAHRKELPPQTHHVFTDNLFSSPQLFRLLRQLGFGATGTARPNCGISSEMKKIKETGRAPNGTLLKFNEVIFIPMPDKQVIQIAWKDSGVVLFLSTVHTGAPHERTLKKRKLPAKKGTKAEAKELQCLFNGDSFKMIPIPTVAAQYNDEMNHVDRGDQIRSYTTYEHRFRRGPWQALLWSFLLEVALANSFILQKKTRQPRWKPYSTLKAWKECICNAIFNTYAAEGGTRKRKISIMSAAAAIRPA